MNKILIPTEKCLELMIFEEEKQRTSKEYVDKCSAVKNEVNGWMRVTAELQSNIAKSFGFVDDISHDIAVNHLRIARYLYPNNPVFQTPLYVKHNKAHGGNFAVNDQIPNVELYTHENIKTCLYDILHQTQPTVIFAGSHT